MNIADLTRQGKTFGVANQDAVAITAALATTYTGLVIQNKLKSFMDVIVLGCSYSIGIAVPTATALGLMRGTMSADISTNTITAYNRYNRSLTSGAVVASGGATIGTPTLEELLASAWVEATTAGSLSQPNYVPLDGRYVLKPGEFLAFYSKAANSAAFLFSFLWAEVPLDGGY